MAGTQPSADNKCINNVLLNNKEQRKVKHRDTSFSLFEYVYCICDFFFWHLTDQTMQCAFLLQKQQKIHSLLETRETGLTPQSSGHLGYLKPFESQWGDEALHINSATRFPDKDLPLQTLHSLNPTLPSCLPAYLLNITSVFTNKQ